MSWFVARWMLGLAIFAAAHFFLARAIQESIPWTIEDARQVTGPSPENDGKFVVVLGRLDAKESTDDPEYVLPRRYLVLRRQIEALEKDSDDDLHWTEVDAIGSLHAYESHVAEATVSGFRFRLDRATFSYMPMLVLDDESLRTDSRPAGVSYARWDPARRLFIAGSDVVPGDAYEATLDGTPEVEQVRATLRFRGYERGAQLAVAGIQSGDEIMPVTLFPGEEPVIATAGAVEALRQDHTKDPAFEIVAILFAIVGLLLVFMHPYNVGFWCMSCGVGSLITAFVNGVRTGFGNLAVTVSSAVAIFATLVVASSTPRIVWVLAWVAGCVVVIALVRILVKRTVLDENDSLFD